MGVIISTAIVAGLLILLMKTGYNSDEHCDGDCGACSDPCESKKE